MTANDDNIIINHDFNFSIDDLDNKSLKNKKINKSSNIIIITQELEFDMLCNLCIKSKAYTNYKS